MKSIANCRSKPCQAITLQCGKQLKMVQLASSCISSRSGQLRRAHCTITPQLALNQPAGNEQAGGDHQQCRASAGQSSPRQPRRRRCWTEQLTSAVSVTVRPRAVTSASVRQPSQDPHPSRWLGIGAARRSACWPCFL